MFNNSTIVALGYNVLQLQAAAYKNARFSEFLAIFTETKQ